MSEFDDVWELLPEEEETEPTVPPSAEQAALHVGAPAEWERTFEDPAPRDVATADENWSAFSVAEDEDDGVLHREADHELDVQELLERQHYSFAPSTEERTW
jgi:hypothetical protein